jgi:3-oxoacyl-[acyl-carrier protein] reductase
MMSERSLVGRVAVVTGAATGIGSAIVRLLADRGAAVAINHLRQDGPAAEVCEAITKAGGTAIAVDADVRSQTEVDAMAAHVRAALGDATILINNAGAYPRIPWDALTATEWESQISTNLTSAFLCARAFTAQLATSASGRIVNIGSVVSRTGHPDLTSYAAAKAGLVGFTRSLARALGGRGITVNCIEPGSIRVDAERHVLRDVDASVARQMVRQAIPRRGEPLDIAYAVAFLCSDEASFITGQTLTVDGGWSFR